MPIASAVTWGQSNISSRSSLFSFETPPDQQLDDNGRGGFNREGGDRSGDYDDTKEPVPGSIRNYGRGVSHLESSYSHDDESIEGLGWIRQKCGEFIDDERTQLFILILIAVNSVMYGVATFPAVKNNPDIQRDFEIVDLIVLIIFTIESVMQFVFNGPRRFLKDGWLVFDLVIVVISWVSVEIDELKALRVFRAFRFVTRVSILRNVVVALFSIVPAITAIFTLLLLIFYIYAVMFTQLFKNFYAEGYTQADYFGRMDYSLFTLFQLLCLVSLLMSSCASRSFLPWLNLLSLLNLPFATGRMVGDCIRGRGCGLLGMGDIHRLHSHVGIRGCQPAYCRHLRCPANIAHSGGGDARTKVIRHESCRGATRGINNRGESMSAGTNFQGECSAEGGRNAANGR